MGSKSADGLAFALSSYRITEYGCCISEQAHTGNCRYYIKGTFSAEKTDIP